MLMERKTGDEGQRRMEGRNFLQEAGLVKLVNEGDKSAVWDLLG